MFSAYTFLSKGTFREVDELATHFIMTCDDDSASFSIKCMAYREGLVKTITFFWDLGGMRLYWEQRKPQNSMADITVPVTPVLCAVIQEPVFFA